MFQEARYSMSRFRRILKKLATVFAQPNAVQQLNSIHLHGRDTTLIAEQLISHPEEFPP